MIYGIISAPTPPFNVITAVGKHANLEMSQKVEKVQKGAGSAPKLKKSKIKKWTFLDEEMGGVWIFRFLNLPRVL